MNSLLDIVSTAVSEVTETGSVPSLTPDMHVAELALDSVQLAELVSTVAERTGARIDIARSYGAETIGELMALLVPGSRA